MKKFAAIVTAVSILAMTAASAVAAPVTFRFAGQQPVEHQCTKMMNDFAQNIQKKTNGRVKVEVYPASQLGDYTLVMEELIRGTIDMSVTSFASSFDPRFELVYINGYVSGYDQAKKVFAPGAWLPNKLSELGRPLGVRVLGSYVEGMIGVGSTKPLKEPLNPKVDKGVLTRVPNMDTYMLGAQAMGFRTITIPWADVYQSLQTGVCDSVNAMATAAVYTGLGDVIKYWYATNYSMEYLPFMISEKSWAKLSPEDQKIFQEEAKAFTLKSIDTAKAEDTKYMDLMKKKGIQVFTYTEEELKPIKAACVTSWEKLGKRGMTPELMEEFKKHLGN
ncbi:MAG: TRAP transporter substrate-binding protein DctP [Synergistaceae bacterium]|nr:TRAP transporter substrate-binding protein DctP [Synergistaceae bacterium]